MIDPNAPPEVTIERQARIIDALVRRASRQHEVGDSAYALFQSAVTLQGQVWAKTRDLERTSSELEIARFDREQTQRRLTEALDAMEGGFALFNEGRLQVCNDLFKSILPDISARILPGLTVEDYFRALQTSRHLADPDRACRDLAEAIRGPAGGASMSFVLELQADRWFQISQQRTRSGNIILLQTEITDIVRKNRMEKDLLIDMQAHYLQAAFDHMSLGICTFSRAGEVTIRNGRFRELLGVPYTLVRDGTEFTTILRHIRDNRLVAEADIADIDHWPTELRHEGRLRKRLHHAGGRVLDLHVHLLPDRGFLVDIADVTLESRATELLEKRVRERTHELTEANRRLREQHEEQRRVEEELRLAKEEVEAAMSSKTRFLAAASHDLLQPVNAAKLLISTLAEMAEGTDMARLTDRLAGSFASMESLLHALLDISRLESTGSALTPTEFCLGTVMRSVVEDQAMVAAQKGLRLDMEPCSAWVRSDREYLTRSLRNLVVNAIQYTERGRVLVGCRRRGDRVVLQVWDTGIGILPADHARIFEEFARADNVPPGSGMGLGLSIVERTCRHLGHQLSVHSEPGRGSVFSIEIGTVLPRDDCPGATGPDLSNGEADLNLIVLIVENDPEVLFATTQKLESWGASVLAAGSTVEAVRLVDEIGMAPDVVLADYQLDGDDTGIAAIKALRAATGSHIPAIMITADQGDEVLRAGLTEDFTVLRKPVQLSRLRPLIDWKTRAPAPLSDESIA
ncbi:PAS-domain containing protein [Rhodovulum tesquicola]|uniref:PAS domain-containing hybrid sensor histidine kinase/response regulator n=1 Tax=Rhodovulum tesquicola TaxID=540254 RepID=UPI002096B114|nr:PAS-domain containing protein [Rhodovulum tesquicola]MCO8143941.1 PAS-domain containing protein [Rhodovulum tesquicola]